MTDHIQRSRPPMTRLLLALVPLAVMLGAFVWIASLDPRRLLQSFEGPGYLDSFLGFVRLLRGWRAACRMRPAFPDER